VFSRRTPSQLAPNRLSEAVARRRADGGRIIDLTESNPTRAGFAYPDDLLAPLADRAALRYEPQPFGMMAARAAVADDYRRRGVDVRPDRIALTTSTSDAYSLLFKLLADAGDEVLVPRPSYPLFEHLTALDALIARPYDLEYHGAWSIDFASVEAALGPRVRAVLVVNPNNPTGSFITSDELARLAALCAPRGIAIVADEVFADYELESGAWTLAGRSLERRDVLSFTLGGLSKSVGLPQVKLGWIAAGGPDALVARALERLELICDTYLGVSTPAQVAAPALLTHGSVVRHQILERIRANYAALQSLAAAVPTCRVLRADAGWYGVMQVPALATEDDLVVDLLARDGVLAHPGYFFDFAREAFLVVSLLTPPSDFAEGVGRLLRHFDCSPATP
jgi:aspartate/methionine/tyrosine aminotransferase